MLGLDCVHRARLFFNRPDLDLDHAETGSLRLLRCGHGRDSAARLYEYVSDDFGEIPGLDGGDCFHFKVRETVEPRLQGAPKVLGEEVGSDTKTDTKKLNLVLRSYDQFSRVPEVNRVVFVKLQRQGAVESHPFRPFGFDTDCKFLVILSPLLPLRRIPARAAKVICRFVGSK